MKPGEDGVGVDVLVEVSQQVAEYKALVSMLYFLPPSPTLGKLERLYLSSFS